MSNRDPYGAAIRPSDCRDAATIQRAPARYSPTRGRVELLVATLETGRQIEVPQRAGCRVLSGCTALLPGAWALGGSPWHCLPFPPPSGWWPGPATHGVTYSHMEG